MLNAPYGYTLKHGEFVDEEDNLLCPVCGFDYTHLKGSYLVNGNDNYEAGWRGRGDLQVIEMYCEEGHEFELCLGFHKGRVEMFFRSPAKLLS